MELILFITLTAILITFIIFSYFHDKKNEGNGVIFVRMTGWLLFFLLCVNFMTEGIDHKTGSTTIQTGNETITTTEAYNYSTYHNFPVAFFMGIMSALAFITCFFEIRGGI